MTILKGMTWNHPRGLDPMLATAKLWREQTGVEIDWEARSLQDFESFPVQELARAYDLIVIDHPHVGQITAENCLTPLDGLGRDADFAAMARASIGQSFPSYFFDGHQWAFPIDAATQVQAYRPDRLGQPLTRWDEVIDLARQGRVTLPMRPPHAMMTFFTLAANLGTPCATPKGDLIALEAGIKVIDLIRAVTQHLDPADFDRDPIAASEALSAPDGDLAVMPLGYGYVSYALQNFRPRRLAFADIPAAGNAGPIGSALGGTGIAVSAFSKNRDAAIDYAYWVASGPIQSGLYAASGGQPGHADAWASDTVNRPTGNFYRATRKTLDTAYVRPRHNGYMAFQAAASERLSTGLRSGEDAEKIVASLNHLFRESF